MLLALLAGTVMRIGEAAGLHVDDVDLTNCVITIRRAVWKGRERSPKTENAMRAIDIDADLAEMLRGHMGEKTGRVFESQTGSPISGNNILERVLHPLLEKLAIPKAGLHAFRHSRVTQLRTNGTLGGFADAVDWAFLFANDRPIFPHGSRVGVSTAGRKQSGTQSCWAGEITLVGPKWTQFLEEPEGCN